jgi:hypothetical protein
MIERAASGKSSSRTPDWRLFYWGWVAVLFTWAAWQRFSLPLDPIADPDTWGYLAPALRKLVGAEFGHTDGRNFVYPAFVFSLLRPFGDFRAIVITQHLLGLLAGALLLIAWRRARLFVPDSHLSRTAHDGLGLLAATIFLLAGEPTRFEMQLRPEGVCAFVVAINLYLVLQFIAFSFVEKRRPWPAVGFGIGIAFTSILLASAKPSLGLIAPVALLPVGIFFFKRGLFRQKIALAVGVALSAALLLVPEHFLSRPDETSRTSLPTLLFVNHARLIRDQMADDLQRSAAIPYPRDWLQRIHGALSTEITKSAAGRPGHFWSLGFDPDYLMYEKSSIVAQLRREFGNDVPALFGFYRYYYWRIWRERPFVMIQKIGEQMGIFYSQMCPAYNREKSLYLASGYSYGATILKLPSYPELWTTYPPAVEFVRRTELLAQSAPIIRQPLPLRMTLSLLAGMYRPLLWGAFALSAAILFQPRYRRRLGWLAALVLFVYSYNAATCLEVAIINSLEGRRYLTVQMFFALFAQLFAAWLLLEMVLEMRDRKKVSDPGTRTT